MIFSCLQKSGILFCLLCYPCATEYMKVEFVMMRNFTKKKFQTVDGNFVNQLSFLEYRLLTCKFSVRKFQIPQHYNDSCSKSQLYSLNLYQAVDLTMTKSKENHKHQESTTCSNLLEMRDWCANVESCMKKCLPVLCLPFE